MQLIIFIKIKTITIKQSHVKNKFNLFILNIPKKVEESVKLEQFVAFIFDLESIKKIFSPPVRFAHSRAQRTQRGKKKDPLL